MLGMGSVRFAGTGTLREHDNEILRRFRYALKSVRYLRPNRIDPWRARTRTPETDDYVGFDGRWTADVMSVHANDMRSFPIAPDRPIDAAKAAEVIDRVWRVEDRRIRELIDDWMSHLGLARRMDSKEEGKRLHL